MEQPEPNPNSTPADETPTRAGAGPSSVPQDLTGQTFADFEIQRLLGHGGMGEVYLARQVSLDRPVALKVLRPELLDNPRYMSRFEAEAWAAAKLNHSNIVHIYSLGDAEGRKFIAMEYVHGTNLREYLARKGVPELPLALSIMKQTAQAVGAAGEVGLVHRDIKPENLLLTRKGQVKVADFGLCRTPDADKLHLTQPGVALGTPMYMSPEQVQGHALDHRSDLYSMGVTFYHLLAGLPPFTADSPVALALKHVRDQPVSLAVHRPDLPKALVDLVMKLMAKSPKDRYASASEVVRDLALVRDQMQANATMEAQALASATVSSETEALDSKLGKAFQAPPFRLRLPRVPVGRGTLSLLALVSLAAGSAWGWAARAPDLLSRRAPAGSSAPGLWMADWQGIRRMPSASAQYGHAQTGVPSTLQVPAWLAVPGRFPHGQKTAYDAYVQLVRELFRLQDADRLEALAGELAQSPYGPSLAHAARAASASLKGDTGAVLEQFTQQVPNIVLMDPPLAELCLEVVLASKREPGLSASESERLAKLRDELLEPLRLRFLLLRDRDRID